MNYKNDTVCSVGKRLFACQLIGFDYCQEEKTLVSPESNYYATKTIIANTCFHFQL